ILVAALQTVDADLIFPVEHNDSGHIDTGEGSTVNETASVRMEYVGFNTNQEPFYDPVVRQAIAQAIDKEDISDIMLEGNAVAADTLLSAAVFGHSGDIERIEYNVEEAKEQV